MFRTLVIGLLLTVVSAAASAADITYPPATGDFMSYCANDMDGCANAVWFVGIKISLADLHSTCPPDSYYDSSSDKVSRQFTQWISAHPATLTQPTDTTLAQAWGDIWPCR